MQLLVVRVRSLCHLLYALRVFLASFLLRSHVQLEGVFYRNSEGRKMCTKLWPKSLTKERAFSGVWAPMEECGH